MQAQQRPRVVIVGGGFAGLAAAAGLRRTEADLTLIDQHNHHVFTPLIYQVATAMLEPSEIAHPIRSVLRDHEQADFRLGRVSEVDTVRREVHSEHGTIPYDYLILAAGSSNNYFKHPEIAESSFGINDVGEAVALRNHLLQRFEQAAWETSAEERRRLLSFVIVGGGPTGVEFAGSLAELVYGILHRDFPALDLDEVAIHLIEGSEAPLPPFHPRLQRAAAKALAKRRVTVSTGIVEGVSSDSVRLHDGTMVPDACIVRLGDGTEIPAGTVVWAAGVRAEGLVDSLGIELGAQQRVPVSATLQLAGHPEVLAVGDLAEIRGDGKPLPMLAPVAMQSGAHAARVLTDLIAGREPQPFRYKAYPTMATIGRGDAVVEGNRLRVHGLTGWLLWLVVHLGRIAGVRARFSVVVDWSTAFLLRDRPMRLIIRPRRPDLDR
ncbi:MAG TPA: NAD(P)/FAD-dependent oxidoreductase [Solirubrobacteraceae bacterium]|jgi:NADH dehydrogenase|nr:NAD(P)/FAD-dependent oxidoreductase [Solirubrobacteraceae bacterium]